MPESSSRKQRWWAYTPSRHYPLAAAIPSRGYTSIIIQPSNGWEKYGRDMEHVISCLSANRLKVTESPRGFLFLHYNITLVFMTGKRTYLYCVVIIIKKTLESMRCAGIAMGRSWTNRSKWMNSVDKRFHPNILIFVQSVNVPIAHSSTP